MDLSTAVDEVAVVDEKRRDRKAVTHQGIAPDWRNTTVVIRNHRGSGREADAFRDFRAAGNRAS
jgi:hypothetical protein